MARAHGLNRADAGQLNRLCHFEQLRFVCNMDLLHDIKAYRSLLFHVVVLLEAAPPLFLVSFLTDEGGLF